MKKLGVPGASLALIDGGKVVYEGGLGVRELGKSAPVDANALFMAASNTKGMYPDAGAPRRSEETAVE